MLGVFYEQYDPEQVDINQDCVYNVFKDSKILSDFERAILYWNLPSFHVEDGKN